MKTFFKLFIGATLIFVGLYAAIGPALYRNEAVQTAAGIIDFKDRRCRSAVVAKGVACPEECAVRPARSPEERYGVPECRSRLWVATCGKNCAPRKGLVRLPDGELASSGVLVVELKGGSAADFSSRLDAFGATLDGGVSGLNRYLAEFPNPDDRLDVLQRMRKNIADIDLVLTAGYDVK